MEEIGSSIEHAIQTHADRFKVKSDAVKLNVNFNSKMAIDYQKNAVEESKKFETIQSEIGIFILTIKALISEEVVRAKDVKGAIKGLEKSAKHPTKE